MFLSRKGGMQFVHRTNPATPDITQATLTFDQTWRSINLSAIVPALAKAVILSVRGKDATAGSAFRLRTVTDTEENGRMQIRMQSINYDELQQCIIALTPALTVGYWGSTGFDTVEITVVGWFV